MKKPKILILTANYGNGHLQVARALQERFLIAKADVCVRNMFQETNPRLNEWTRKLYLKSFTKGGKHLYRLFYYSSQEITKRQNLMLFPYGYSTLRKIIDEEQPDAIINTYPSYAVEYFSTKINHAPPTYTVITDYCLHHAWIQPSIAKYYVATQHLKNLLINHDIDPNKIAVTGIPVEKQFEHSHSRKSLIDKYQLNANLKTVLIVAGAYGVSKEIKYICDELRKEKGMQILVVCGKNQQLFHQLETKYQQENRVRVFGYVNQMAELFELATCVVTKPGGIILSEAVVKNVPIVLLGATPGQERENALFFQSHGAAIFCEKWEQLVAEIQQLVTDDEKLKEMKAAVTSLLSPQAAGKIVTDVLETYDWKVTQSELKG
ncbi:glycosyltransferase [Robertmurraya yapensis]|uniref:Glycosyltransferase n=2 Tax=Bacillaceae TaxID=186817 RepID=A0A3S0KL62_9BACI|nr:glycosyltransferase [Bacillus yapensis]RTR29129.1 glycosyltransferase [Bacillus yapensis]TKS94734.1 glycosyltransferase [Bacillus yapensis]